MMKANTESHEISEKKKGKRRNKRGKKEEKKNRKKQSARCAKQKPPQGVYDNQAGDCMLSPTAWLQCFALAILAGSDRLSSRQTCVL